MSDNIKFELVGLKAFSERLGEVASDVAKEVRKAINQGALMVKTDAIKSIKKISAGRVYRRGTSKKKTKTHIASKPGDAPNVDTGNLWRNIRVSTGKQIMARGYYAEVKAVTPYAVRLEFGGADKKGRYIKPRPYMGPAMEKNVDKIQALLKSALRKSI